MKLFEIQPHRLLRPFIVCYWVMEGDEAFSHKIIPDGYPEMIFHFGDCFHRHEADLLVKQAQTIVAGQLTKPITISPSGKTGTIGVKFSETGLWRLFGIRMSAVTNATESAEDVLQIGTDLQDLVIEAPTHETRAQHLDRFFLARLARERHSIATDILLRMTQAKSPISISALCQSEKISVRKLERVFNETVGVSPKTYLRLIRFQRVYKLLQQQTFSRPDVSFLGGYFDQSHFNRDFKIFTGEDPTAYFNSVPLLAKFFMSR